MSKSLLYVAYYTRNTPYFHEAEKLKHCFEKFKLPYEIVASDNLGSWQKNTHYKAMFIKKMMEKHPEAPLVYLDADAIIHQKPTLFEELDCDVAICHYDNPYLARKELLNGTIYFGPTAAAKHLVDRWIMINQNDPMQIEQVNFETAIIQSEHGLRVYELPPSYTMIYDLMAHLGLPVIEHFQASRRYKRMIDRAR